MTEDVTGGAVVVVEEEVTSVESRRVGVRHWRCGTLRVAIERSDKLRGFRSELIKQD